MMTTICHKHGCYRTAVEGKHFCAGHIRLEANWGRRPCPERKSSRAWHGLYGTKRWKRERLEFLRENPFCAVCGRPAEVVDHIVPHRGDEAVFFDQRNWQPLCREHHGRKTMAETGNLREGDRGVKNISALTADQQPHSCVCACKMDVLNKLEISDKNSGEDVWAEDLRSR